MTTDIMGETQLICPPVQDHLTTQVVIVGSGAAGMRTALDLADAGVPTLLVTRGELTDSATDWAQGGLAAVWRADDSVDLHVTDTLTAGAGLCDEQAVRTLVTRAPGALRRLMADGASFDTDDAGYIDLHLEGGHHARRILHAGGDQSGHEVEVALARRAGALDVCDHARLIDICTDCRGATCGVLVARGGTTVEISCDHVVLATGGIGQLWSTTTNPTVSTGDGLAAGLRAGAVARDVEFMQFHPTILVVPPAHRIPDDRGVLISEAVRGEGAFLVDAHGERVMTGVHPLADLAPRDVVSAAEWAHMTRIGADHLFLDATAFGVHKWETMFPSILQMCRERGIDPVAEPIPVRPGAHYHCGGLVADMAGRTSVPGLWAVGEVACTGVQGANRLASNSLTEGLVMGELAARAIAEQVLGADPQKDLAPHVDPDTSAVRRNHMSHGIRDQAIPEHPVPERLTARRAVSRRTVAPVAASQLSELHALMDRHMSVLRQEAGMHDVLDFLDRLEPGSSLTDDTLTTTNLCTVAWAATTSALARTESRGCHRRSDHPDRDARWQRHLDVCASSGMVRAA